MTRVDELKKKYPTIPRDFIIKWELKQLGVQDTEDHDKVSTWRSAEGSYQIKFLSSIESPAQSPAGGH